MTPLKEKVRVFVEAYMGKCAGNGVEAARAAGYAGDAAALASRASKLLARKDVKAAMKDRVADDPLVADREERQRFWTRVMRARNERNRTIKIPMKDRLEAAKTLARAQGDFVDKHEHKHSGEVVITIPDNGRGDGDR